MESFATTANPPPARSDTSVTVLWVDDDPDFLELSADMLAVETDFEVRTETTPTDVLDRLADVDSLVADYNMPGQDGLELLAAVREDRPKLPVVLCSGSSLPELVDAVVDDQWTEVVAKDAASHTVTLVAARVQQLVACRRTARLARRTLAALDETHEAIAVVAPDDRFAVVNQVFAHRFGYARDDLVGRDWRTCYPDDEVDRLESTALVTVANDWQWTGGCLGQREDGSTFTAQTRIVGLDDGTVVFCVSDPDTER